jgi:hypothetical protein
MGMGHQNLDSEYPKSSTSRILSTQYTGRGATVAPRLVGGVLFGIFAGRVGGGVKAGLQFGGWSEEEIGRHRSQPKYDESSDPHLSHENRTRPAAILERIAQPPQVR